MNKELEEKITKVVKALYGLDARVEVSEAPEETGADFACNVAMRLAKEVHKAPREIAEEIIAALKMDGCSVAGPGFINFTLGDEYYAKNISQGEYLKGSNISQGEYSGKTVICEFSDPNPFKVLHVGHLYTSIVGDAISRMLECAGAKVVRANFGGDVGLHVAKTIYALRYGPLSGERCPTSKDQDGYKVTRMSQLCNDLTIERIAKAYVAGTKLYEEDEAAKAEIVKLNKRIYEIAKAGAGLDVVEDDEVAEIYWRGRELSYQYFNDFYARIGVKFDRYYPESTVAGRGLEEVKRGLAAGVYEESDGAVVYKGEKKGLHTRVFINREGLPTYEAKDVGLIFTKWDDYKFDQSIVITGNDIIEYMKVVLASVGEMTPELPERTRHLTHGNVRLPGNEKMSSRKGNFLKAVDVLEMVRQELGGEKADEKVVLAAIKYAFLKYKIGGDIIFDPKESVAMTGNSGVYLLYSAVRAKKILQKTARHPEAKPRDAFKLPEGHPEVDIVQSSKSSVASFSPSKTLTSSLESSSSRAQVLGITPGRHPKTEALDIALGQSSGWAKASDTGAGDTTKVFEKLEGRAGDTVEVLKEPVGIAGNTTKVFEKSEGRAGDTVEVLKELKDTTEVSNDCTDSASGCSLRSSNVSPECTFEGLVEIFGSEEAVRKLGRKICKYGEALGEAVKTKEPNRLCAYLYELAQEFSRFYEKVQVAGNAHEAELAVLVRAYYRVMEHGLGLLGIEIPEEM